MRCDAKNFFFCLIDEASKKPPAGGGLKIKFYAKMKLFFASSENVRIFAAEKRDTRHPSLQEGAVSERK